MSALTQRNFKNTKAASTTETKVDYSDKIAGKYSIVTCNVNPDTDKKGVFMQDTIWKEATKKDGVLNDLNKLAATGDQEAFTAKLIECLTYGILTVDIRLQADKPEVAQMSMDEQIAAAKAKAKALKEEDLDAIEVPHVEYATIKRSQGVSLLDSLNED